MADIISFTDYLKKRNKQLRVDPGFIEALGDGIKPRSDLVFVDYAAFLQRSWSERGPYLDVFS